MKHNTALPDFSKDITSSDEETGHGSQGKSELCVITKYSINVTLPDSIIVTGLNYIQLELYPGYNTIINSLCYG